MYKMRVTAAWAWQVSWPGQDKGSITVITTRVGSRGRPNWEGLSGHCAVLSTDRTLKQWKLGANWPIPLFIHWSMISMRITLSHLFPWRLLLLHPGILLMHRHHRQGGHPRHPHAVHGSMSAISCNNKYWDCQAFESMQVVWSHSFYLSW